MGQLSKFLLFAGLAAAGCGGDAALGVTGEGMHALTSPDSSSVVDLPVAKPPTVVILDATNHGRAGIAVTFHVLAGGGRLNDSVVTTDANGRAGLGGWTLGPTPTANVVQASAMGQTALTFTVNATWPRRLAAQALGACAIVSDRAFCWGDNSHQELGVNFGPTSAPTPQPSLLSVLATPAELAGSFGNHLCVVMTQRGGYCWGRNDYGQAGSTQLRATGVAPVPLVRTWTMLSAARLTTCGIEQTTGSAFCWGANQRGEIGNPATLPSITVGIPVATLVISTVKFKFITTGWQHACALALDGTAYCWGANLDGQLGIGVIDSSHTSPTPVATDERFATLAAGGLYTCGITVGGRTLCWGQNALGQLGDGTTTSRTVPTPVATTLRFSSIAAGTFFISAAPPELTVAPAAGKTGHTCALTESGQPYCWGWNGWGQLGDGTLQDRLVPTAVAGSLTLNGLALGESSSCGMRGTSAWCWGGNTVGQLGDGSVTRRTVPVKVQLP
jgi:alpha-tubulin suppressor-like RCC1 family protein